MKTYALFLGCNIESRLPGYGEDAERVLDALGIKTVRLRDFSCCGYPLKNPDAGAAALAAARNLAVARARGLDILTLCSCCHGGLTTSQWLLQNDPAVGEKAAAHLAADGLEYAPDVRVRHFLNVLDEEAGTDAIQSRVKKPRPGVKVAVQYGCHLLRPSRVTRVDDPFEPTVGERLLAAAGVTPVAWERRMDCCGAPVLFLYPDDARRLADKKIASAADAADELATVCTYSYLFFQSRMREKDPALSLTTPAGVLALAMGLKKG
ncbi:MAG: CoB--CoM heterodisulfide reductase [Deltaproteobacteria bacterium]|nr:CoB--CoM heterodisulfide reductase [Deltaproteobacteria bacterium]